MAEATRTETFDVSAEKFFRSITDYDSYPELVPSVNGVEVLERMGNQVQVRFTMKIVKNFSYIIRLTEEEPVRLSWEMVESNLFKHMNGFWQLDPEGDARVKVTYHADVGLPLLAPRAVVDKLVGSTLPSMMRTYADHARTK